MEAFEVSREVLGRVRSVVFVSRAAAEAFYNQMRGSRGAVGLKLATVQIDEKTGKKIAAAYPSELA